MAQNLCVESDTDMSVVYVPGQTCFVICLVSCILLMPYLYRYLTETLEDRHDTPSQHIIPGHHT